MTITCIWLPGTGFSTGPDAVSMAFGNALDRSRFEFQPLTYPADYGRGMSYAESVAIGRQILIDAIRATPNRAVCGGYSQGAGIAGGLAAEIGRGEHPDLDVMACALIADPARPVGAGMPYRSIASGYGITGQRFIEGIQTFWAANEGDPITSLPAGNPLRTLADATEFYSLQPGDAQRWMEAILTRARENRWQRWWSLENWRTWTGAIAYARGYLVDGRHGGDYIRFEHAQHLARVISAEWPEEFPREFPEVADGC